VFIRYFARTDETPLGGQAAAYCDVLVATGIPVRLVSSRVAELQTDARGRSSSIWSSHRQLLITPMDGRYINAICGELADWDRFHTPGVRNVLLVAKENVRPQNSQPALMAAMEKFDEVYTASIDVSEIVERVTGRSPIALTFSPQSGNLLRQAWKL
jgi:hypothetical protein